MGPLVTGAMGAGAGGGLGGLLGQVSDTLSYPRRELWKLFGLPEYGHQVLEQYAGMDPESALTTALGIGLDIAGDPLTYAGVLAGGLGGAVAPRLAAGAEGVAEAAPGAVGAFLADESGAANLTRLGEALGITQREYAPAFYSRLSRAAESLPVKTDAASALNKLKGAGVKAEEIQYTGLPEFLGARKGITREEILQHLDQNAIQLGRKDFAAPFTEPMAQRLAELESGEVWDEATKSLRPINHAEGQELFRLQIAKGETGDTSYMRHAEPGGTDYRESLITLPQNPTGTFVPKHFDGEPNTLVHLRTKTRLTPDGKPVHAIEEIQSDWHQGGRDRGYLPTSTNMDDLLLKREDAKDAISKLMNQRLLLEAIPAMESDPDLLMRLSSGFHTIDEVIPGAIAGDLYDLRAARRLLPPSDFKRILELGQIHGPFGQTLEGIGSQIAAKEAEVASLSEMLASVPDAPFKDTWHELALKQAIRDAAEQGHDFVAWTPSELQTARYATPEWALPVGVEGDGPIELTNFLHHPEGISPRDAKITSGMRQFYDQKLPSFANKYLKQWGSQLGPIDVGLDQPWHGFPITPQMREDVLYKGQPLLTPLLAALGGAGALGAGGYAMSQGGGPGA